VVTLTGIWHRWCGQDGVLRCKYQARYGQPPQSCSVTAARPGFEPSRYCRLHHDDVRIADGFLEVGLGAAARAITPQQELVMYDGEVCLGTAAVALPGRSLFEVESQEGSIFSREDFERSSW
jgi:tRNA U34 2-thiouridine synthase MnmA/TrmU